MLLIICCTAHSYCTFVRMYSYEYTHVICLEYIMSNISNKTKLPRFKYIFLGTYFSHIYDAQLVAVYYAYTDTRTNGIPYLYFHSKTIFRINCTRKVLWSCGTPVVLSYANSEKVHTVQY